MSTHGPYATVPRPEPATRRRLPWGAAALGALFGLLLFSAFTHTAKAGFWDRVARVVSGRGTRIDSSSPAVVEKIRQLSRLETVDYSVDKVVEGNRENPYLPSFLVGDRLLLIAHGEVIAGVDLSQMKATDVSVHGSAIQVRLPDPQVLSTRLDAQRTRVYSRTTGLLVPADPNLETQVRLAAEQQFTQAALADGVLDKARQNARTSVSALLNGLGFRHVDVQ
jgi:hypothetical protein